MRALVLLSLLFTVCVSAGLVDLKNSAESIKGLIKERVVDKIKNTAHRIKEVLNNNMAAFKKRLSGFKDKILKKLTLTKEQRAELLERLKLVKRRSTDKVQPMGDSIEEVNLQNHIAGALFQGDMVLTKSCSGNKKTKLSKISPTTVPALGGKLFETHKYPGMRWHEGVKYFFDSSASPQVKSVFKKAAAQWMADTCIDFKEDESAEDSIRVYMEDGCWSFVGRLGGIQNLSLGKGCETVRAKNPDTQ
ncbi:astacin [Ostertagia ostertagi]